MHLLLSPSLPSSSPPMLSPLSLHINSLVVTKALWKLMNVLVQGVCNLAQCFSKCGLLDPCGSCKIKTIISVIIRYYFPFSLCWWLALTAQKRLGRTAVASVRTMLWHQTMLVTIFFTTTNSVRNKTTKQVLLNVLDEAQKFVFWHFYPSCFPPLFCVIKWVLYSHFCCILKCVYWLKEEHLFSFMSWTSLSLHETFLLQEQLTSCHYTELGIL